MAKKIKIYYAAAMLGDRSNLSDNRIIFRELEKRGYEMLTKFVIEDKLDIYKGRKPREIFERDIEHLEETDVVVADISYPSTGVGFEIAYGLLNNKYVISICRKDRINKASALVRGITWKNFQLLTYNDPLEIADEIDKIVKTIF